MSDNSTIDKEAVGHIVTAEELVMDEATIIREQERMANEKKKKAAAKKRKVVYLVLGVILAVGIGFLVWKNKTAATAEENTVTVEATENQTVTYVRVDSVKGNEINYTVLKAEEKAEEDASDQSSEKPSRPDGNSGEMPSFGGSDGQSAPDFSSGEMPDFSSENMPDFSNGNMPDFSSGEKPSFGGGSDSQTVPSFGGGSSKRSSGVLTYNDVTYTLTDETVTELIPVGTDVITKLGVTTTFSRIGAGDCLALVTENIDGEDTIMTVYIVG